MPDMAERPMICRQCDTTMNRHGEKLVFTGEARGPGVDPVLGGMVQEMHACPRCGYVDARPAD
jgi:hypothetical protein